MGILQEREEFKMHAGWRVLEVRWQIDLRKPVEARATGLTTQATDIAHDPWGNGHG
jgi:hypothetical protein